MLLDWSCRVPDSEEISSLPGSCLYESLPVVGHIQRLTFIAWDATAQFHTLPYHQPHLDLEVGT